jgi:hypothetical protein
MASEKYQKLLAALNEHLDALSVSSSDVKTDDELLAIAINALPDDPKDVSFPPQARMSLITKTYQALANPNADDFVVKFLTFLLKPVPLAALLDIEPPVDLAAGLNPSHLQFHDLNLHLLDKVDASSAEKLASFHRHVFEALVDLWLETSTISTADKAAAVLVKLLRLGGEHSFKRIFMDSDVYELILSHVDTRDNDKSKSKVSISQARLLNWLATISSFAWTAISTSHHPDIEAQYGIPSGKGLLDYAAVHMVDYEEDIIMYQTLVRFYTKLLWNQRNDLQSDGSSKALDFLIDHKIHQRLVTSFTSSTKPDLDYDTRFILTDVAEYISLFVSLHHSIFAANKQVVDRIIDTTTTILSSARTQEYIDESPSIVRTVQVLQNIPRSILAALSNSNPLFSLNSQLASPPIFETLGILFHGPLDPTNLPPALDAEDPHPLPSNDLTEIEAAAKLFQAYTTAHPSWLDHALIHANNLAEPRSALAANGFLRLLITARWPVLQWFNGNVAASGKLLAHLASVPKYVGAPDEAAQRVFKAGFEIARVSSSVVQLFTCGCVLIGCL